MASRASTVDKLLDAAEALFFERGIAATPIDEVIDRADVSSATLYRAFASKDALVAATLRRRQARWNEAWDRAIAAVRSPRDRLLAIFDALEAFAERESSGRWCAFLGTAAEYADPPATIRAPLDEDTNGLAEGLLREAAYLGPRAPEVANDLLLVISGHLAMRLRGVPDSIDAARRVAIAVIDAGETSAFRGR